MKKLHLLTLIASLAFAGAAQAQTITGGLSIGTLGGGSFTSNSLTLSSSNFDSSPTGDLSSVPTLSAVPAYSGTVNLSSSPTIDIPDYLEFASANSGVLNGAGTTPPDRFNFELTGLVEEDSTLGNFIGTGILTDSTGVFQPTEASFTLGFAGASNYSLSFYADGAEAAPEPSTWTLCLAACGVLVYLRRRQLNA
jgi:hypothetical protein